jgi:nucleotide-binding universal stress UspA family protein
MLPMTLNATSAGVMAGYDQALAYLAGLRVRLPDVRGLDLIRTGDPADAVLQVALEFNIDLIAMGAHVRSGMAKWLLGSVAQTVVRRSQLPVLLWRTGMASVRSPLRRILVPLDGTEESRTILATVQSLGLQTGAEVVFLHVSDRALTPPVATGGSDPREKFLKIADRLKKSDLVIWQTAADGDPVEAILDHATSLDADLIAMTTQAGQDQEGTLVGEAALAVLGRSDRPVLLERPVLRTPVAATWKYQ